MKRDTQLYINGVEVDLSDEAIIQFTYTMDDLQNPTIVKNTYSQTVKLVGTPTNDKVFGHIYEATRVTESGQFNPLERSPFMLFRNGELFEEGYAKLDEVTVKNGIKTYEVSLFGGLGAFFYALSYDEEGEKKSLADLTYTPDGSKIEFRVYKDRVREAWDYLETAYGDRPIEVQGSPWRVINFAPAWNGLPDGDFSADKAMCYAGTYPQTIVIDGDTYIAERYIQLSKDYTEWETKDLRSYLQRPVVRMRSIVEACCDAAQNGGYTVTLDNTFFNTDNPIYNKAWLSLPILRTLEIPEDSGEVPITWDESVVPSGTTTRNVSFNKNLEGATVDNLYMLLNMVATTTAPDGSYELVNTLGIPVFGSASLTAKDRYGMTLGTATATIGHFSVVENRAIGDELSLSLTALYNLVTLELTITLPANVSLRSVDAQSGDTRYSFTDPQPIGLIGENYLTYTGATAARSGVRLTQDMLLSTEHTPADYLISYAKMCGLHFLYDKNSRTISIVTRNTLYGSAKHIDITDRIDRGSEMKITPIVAEDKWYDFNSPIEGSYAEYYKDVYGKEYGEQVVDTGYEFNSEHIKVTDSIIFNAVAEVRERSKYYNRIEERENGTGGRVSSVFLDAGHQVTYRNGGAEEQRDAPTVRVGADIEYLDPVYKSYYSIPLCQFHDKENGSLDINNAMMVVADFADVYMTLTDDTPEMMTANEGEPCWILQEPTATIRIPRFSRYDNNLSLEWGTPIEVDDPRYDPNAGYMPLYAKYWESYIGDRFNTDTKVVNCKVDLRGLQVGEALLRNFYYFDGAVWALNKISNYTPTKLGLTECEFVKVADIDNYENGQNI